MLARIAVTVYACFLVTSALAQDPTKTESKHYTLAFENDKVQVVNVHYGPHEKSGMHDHPGGVVVILTGGHLKFTDPSGKVIEVFAKPGESRWFPPFKHRVENVGDTPYNAVYIGVKNARQLAQGMPAESSPDAIGEASLLTEYVLSMKNSLKTTSAKP